MVYNKAVVDDIKMMNSTISKARMIFESNAQAILMGEGLPEYKDMQDKITSLWKEVVKKCNYDNALIGLYRELVKEMNNENFQKCSEIVDKINCYTDPTTV